MITNLLIVTQSSISRTCDVITLMGQALGLQRILNAFIWLCQPVAHGSSIPMIDSFCGMGSLWLWSRGSSSWPGTKHQTSGEWAPLLEFFSKGELQVLAGFLHYVQGSAQKGGNQLPRLAYHPAGNSLLEWTRRDSTWTLFAAKELALKASLQGLRVE